MAAIASWGTLMQKTVKRKQFAIAKLKVDISVYLYRETYFALNCNLWHLEKRKFVKDKQNTYIAVVYDSIDNF